MYVRDHDYELYCDATTLAQVVNSDASLRKLCEYSAEDQIKSYLMHRYDLKKPYGEFTDTTTWSPTTIYYTNERVYLDATAYAALTAYVVDDLVSYQGNVYICIDASTGNLPTDTDFFTLIGDQYELYFITPTADAWNFQKNYIAGNTAYYKNKVYTCALPHLNITPDSTYGVNYWGSGTTYSVAAGTLPSDTTKWTKGDNRNNFLLRIYISLVLWDMFLKVAPRNIPKPREETWKQALEWLDMAAKGTVTADLPLIAPEQGSSIRWGSIAKNDNVY